MVCRVLAEREEDATETIAIVMIVLWLVGLVSSYTMGGLIHIPFGYRGRIGFGSRYSR